MTNTHIKINKVTKRSQAKGVSNNKGLEVEHVFCLLVVCFKELQLFHADYISQYILVKGSVEIK